MYRLYVTETLRSVAENTAAVGKYYGGSGSYITKRYSELLSPAPQEQRTGREIIDDVIRRAGLVVIG